MNKFYQRVVDDAHKKWPALQRKILARQNAEMRLAISSAPVDQIRANAEYEAWCAANGREPIWDWTPTVTITNGASIIELRGDAIARADRWLALCKKVPPKDGEPPPLPIKPIVALDHNGKERTFP